MYTLKLLDVVADCRQIQHGHAAVCNVFCLSTTGDVTSARLMVVSVLSSSSY